MGEKVKSQYHAIVEGTNGVQVLSNPIRAALRKEVTAAVDDGGTLVAIIKGKQVPFGKKVVETLSIG